MSKKTKKDKSNKVKKISRWFIMVLIIFFLIVNALNMVIFSLVLYGVISIGNESVTQSETSYLASIITYGDLEDSNAEWAKIAESYYPGRFDDYRLYGAIKSAFTLEKNKDYDLVYGAGTYTEMYVSDEERERLSNELVSGKVVSKDVITDQDKEKILQLKPGEHHTMTFDEDNKLSEHGSIYVYPVFDDYGIVYGYMAIEMHNLYQTITMYMQIAMAALLFSVLETAMMTIFLFIVYKLIKKRIITPLKQVETASKEFVEVSRTEEDPSKWVFNKPVLKKHDEIDSVNDSVANMANDMTSYMQTILDETKEKQRIGTELELAAKIQMDALETKFPAFPNITNVDIFASMTPAKEVGGDFYDFFPVDESHIGLVIADVSGKGVPASIYMMISKIILRNIAVMGTSPKDTLIRLNEQISEKNENSMFVTVWFGILDVNTGHVVATNAGHEYPIIKHKDGQFEIMKDKHGIAIGAMSGLKYREYEFDLDKGGALFLYTDGAPEATNADDELFGMDRVVESLNKNPEGTANELIETLKKDIDEYVGDAPQFDDLTLMAIRLL